MELGQALADLEQGRKWSRVPDLLHPLDVSATPSIHADENTLQTLPRSGGPESHSGSLSTGCHSIEYSILLLA